ncbi:hypothetical protein PR202_gn00455 [Eleusine coracana subsp. coracana]|uniref:Uncharacterized protein n=1 Tax=Eleusine coracana subsp. coracana TaxID=191504 RepID=A0AAV5G3M5_ELECO|nr:hypothetical protein PR202_gn00455 [Eleusine coracana subsp. coracana]
MTPRGLLLLDASPGVNAPTPEVEPLPDLLPAPAGCRETCGDGESACGQAHRRTEAGMEEGRLDLAPATCRLPLPPERLPTVASSPINAG